MITNKLIFEIKSKINDNQKQGITGDILQGVLVDMVESLSEAYPQTYTEEQKAQARANIDALSNHNGEITKEKLSIEVQAILNDVANKQNITDESLATIAKTIVGAINEVYNGGLKDASIATSKIKDGAVTTDKLADTAVTEDKLASSSVTNAKIANASVSEEKIADNSISTAKVKDGAITEPKLDTDLVNVITSAVQPAELASALATALASYVAKTDIVATTGSATDKVMSQHGVTEAINGVNNKVTELESEMNTQLNGSITIEEITITADQAGFINLSNGTITNPSSSWKHTILVPIDSFVSVTGFINHNSVAGIALYSSDRFDSYLGGFTGLISNVVITDLSPYTSQYPTARYVAFTTDTLKKTLVCKYNNTVVISGLKDEVEDLKNKAETLDGSVSGLKNDITVLESKMSNLRKISVSNKMLHISFDDTINAFKDLIDNNRASLFDSPFFGILKTLHNTYGCVFSCYCFYDMIDLKYVSKITTISSPSTTSVYYLSKTDESYSAGLYVYRNSIWTAYDNSTMRDDYILFSLSDMTDTYSEELSNNSDWLKFGFHWIDGLEGLNGIKRTSLEVKTAYDNTISDIVRITGTVKSIDMVPRLQGFGGSIDICRALRDCDCGCLGFLTADYSETNGGQGGQSQGYYLTTPATVVLWNKGQWYDYQERLHFYPSSLRLDGQTATATETYMNKFLSVSKWGQAGMICMYCHENQMFINGNIASNYIAALTKVAEWAIKYDYLFGYPMDRIRMSF